jgi:hypothetical protein
VAYIGARDFAAWGPIVINLIVHMGLCSGTTLISHFLDHYYRLGVERFLVILHTEPGQEALREEALATLQTYDALPAMEVDAYTCELKRRRINYLLDGFVSDDDWVLHADLDEFHIYPDTLRAFLDSCTDAGHTFAQGKWVDRVAENRRLNPVERSPSLWAQFPLTADISALGGGWTTKVCAAKGFHRSGDGGTHSIDFGFTPNKNYEMSAAHPTRFPHRLAIDHFKWDATVVSRLENRLDLYRAQGLSVYEESARILGHLCGKRELSMTTETPSARQFHYVRPSLLPIEEC